MEKFKISDIQNIFAGDLEKFREQTRVHLGTLLEGAPGERESLSEAIRYAHALKGVASTVEAWALSNWGADLENLFELAGTYLGNAREKAEDIFRFVLQNMEAWSVMNTFTLVDQLEPAWDYYQGLRAMMEERWRGYLGAVTTSSEALPSEAAESAPAHQVPGAVLVSLAPPPLRRRADPSNRGSTLSTASTPVVAPARPTPLSLHAPPLQRASGKKGVSVPTEAPATPSIVRVSPPSLLRKSDKTAATSSAPAQANSSVQPPASDNLTPAADADLIEMVGQEVSNYLGELANTLKGLPSNPADQERWEVTRRLFHTIKGTAATFHLDAVSGPAKAAEARCIVAIEDPEARTFDTFGACVERAAAIAAAIHSDFPRDEIELAMEEAKAGAVPLSEDADDAASGLDADMAGFFVRDARDQITTIEQAVLRWERGEPAEAQAWAAQRGFHTIKGAANSIGLTKVALSVHEAEGFLEGVAAGGAQGNPALFAFLLRAVDQLRSYTSALSESPSARWTHDWSVDLREFRPESGKKTALMSTEPAQIVVVDRSPSLAPDAEAEESHTLRIDASRLHQLMNLIGEVVIDRSRLEKKIELLTRLHHDLGERNAALTASVQSFQQQFEFNLLQDRAARSRIKPSSDATLGSPDGCVEPESEFSELEFDRYDQFSILARSLLEISHDVGEVSVEMSRCLESFGVDNTRFRETSRHLQGSVTSLGLLPVSTLFPRLQRAFRDALHVEGKEAELELEGGAALLDKVVIDKMFVPLMHLLRNAVAHGIEDSAARKALKKPARGRVRVSTTQLSNQIIIHIEDDGGGVRADFVRRRAIEKGWLASDAPPLTPDQVLHFIFQPGFSTANKVTSVSGRGVGLDVVRKEIEGLNGSVELRYEPGVKSTWTLRLPMTVSISEAILAECGGITFAFPINFIESGMILDTSTIRVENGRTTCAAGDTRLPLSSLSQLFSMRGASESSNGLVISAGDRRAVISVDRVLRRQEIVVKQLDSLFARHPLLNGATLDAEGQVIPILNLPSLLKFSERAAVNRVPREPRIEVAEADQTFRVLIADDSLSVRKVQERLLAGLGCHVTSASDGLHALQKLREGRFEFVFTDLEMPRINGYELISEIRGNPAWASLPIVVISSRGGDKYITKAMNLGATSFLSKPFTQEQLQQVLQYYAGWNPKARLRGTPMAAMQEAV